MARPLRPHTPKALTAARCKSLEDFLAQQQQQDLLRFITCGSVDDGKSTLIGRLLWDTQQLLDDQMATLSADSKRYGTQGEALDFALLVDGLAAEREQGITIDVAYRFFSTPRRKFIVADTPGHEQYTRNMVTGASTAHAAILLVDARHGLQTQTRRHAYLVAMMGIRHVLLAVNKMDLVDYQASVFSHIEHQFATFSAPLGFVNCTAIPVSALKGDNITARSAHCSWYHGPTLLACLETVDPPRHREGPFALPVQAVARPHADFRGFAGTVAQGRIAVGDEVRVTASGQTAVVASLDTLDGPLQHAMAGEAVTLVLDRQVDLSRGDVLTHSQAPLDMTDQFEATLVWMHEDMGLPGRSYDLKLATQWTSATITNIKHQIDINTLTQRNTRNLQLNDIAVCNIATAKPIAFDRYAATPVLGSFILVDRLNHATVAAGMITHSLRRAQNVHAQAVAIGRPERERLNGHPGRVIWFTGLSGSGKSTLANALELELHRRGMRTYLLDGDNIRQGLNKDLGFTEVDRVENIRRIAEVAKLMMDAGLIVMTAFISPFRRDREMARERIGAEDFLEIYVSTPLSVCEQRDVKGLYKKARNGQIPNMTGINSPYEVPESPALCVDGHSRSIADQVQELLRLFVA